MENENRTLYINETEHDRVCDGCGVKIIGPHLSGIESCCGGCYRNLCIACVRAANEMVDDFEQEKP